MGVWHTKQAARTLRHGGIIAYPTEGVWGLGCDPWNQRAVERLLLLKQRPMHKGLILIAAHWSQLPQLMADLSVSERQLLCQDRPQPTTWIIPDSRGAIPLWIKGLHKEVAVRVSTHPGARELCRYFGGPVVSTSANTSGQEPARSRREIQQNFGRRLDYVLDGPLGGHQRPSEIRSLKTGSVLRSGQ